MLKAASKDNAERHLVGRSMGLRLVAITAAVMMLSAPAAVYAESISFPTVQVDGKTYIEANAVAATVGEGGTYDPATKKYVLNVKSIPSVVKKVSPSVVAIIGQDKEMVSKVKDPRDAIIHGTGVVIRQEGWIVTNAHVISGMQKPLVVTPDGKSYPVTKIYSDELTDLALIRIEAKGLKPATLAPESRKTEVGETVVAVGTPISFALQNSVTAGIVSGMDRVVDNGYKLIQTDAAINPGNSGGPLVNMDGEVIGINTLKYYGEYIDNMGFAIPVDTVRWVVNDFLNYGELRRPSIGIAVEENWAASVGLPTDRSLKITNVISPQAKNAGIKAGDTLLEVNGKEVCTLADVNEALKGQLPGDTAKLTLLSKGKKTSVNVTLGKVDN
ncbi:S1C family serine protease [Paenibacillus marinisediminis]